MKSIQTRKPLVLRTFLFYSITTLSLTFIILFLLFLQPHNNNNNNNNNPKTTTTSLHDPLQETKPPQNRDTIQIRPGFTTYDAYIKRQLDKTLNPKLREIWKTRDWERKVNVFSNFFSTLRKQRLLSNSSKALCIGARVGQEVAALRRIGVADSVGMDLVPYPPLVVEGDFHNQPFQNDTFDFEFSNVFDHALYPYKFVGEIERTLKPGGVCVLHVALSRRGDKYSANDLYSVEPLVELFRDSDMLHVRTVDGFGLDTEVAFRKKKR